MPSATEAPREPLPDSELPARPPDLSDKLPRLGPPKQRKAPSKPPNPPIPTPPLREPPPRSSLSFAHPTRRILSPGDHDLFLQCPTHEFIVSFALNLSDSVRDTPVSAVAKEPLAPVVNALISILDRAEEAIQQCPPEDTGSRFGNPGFRKYISFVSSHAGAWHAAHLSLPDDNGALDELTTYFSNAFGSPIRIDYGSGHELHYLVYLLCLYQLSLLPRDTFPALTLVVFPRYLRLMRRLQGTYYLEPAGSHGVWGLDDYHFLPFLFGASQLANHPFIRPLAIHSSATIEAYSDDYLYLDMVRQVNATKTVQGLRWHSPMLDDISGVKEGWGKICNGMKKMFSNEVVGKLVVMQHFLFGGLLPAVEGMTPPQPGSRGEDGAGSLQTGEERVAEGHEGHLHNADAWGDCCGIKVPSSAGAVGEMKKRMGGGGPRPLPFD